MVGVHRGQMKGGGWSITGVGGTRWGGGGGGGTIVGESTVGVPSTSKNRPSQHKYKSPTVETAEIELKGSKKT